MKATVVIPTYNEETNLTNLLDDLKHQTLKGFETIVSDAQSTDRTRTIAQEAGARVVEGGMPAAGRNAGAAAACGEVLVFLDADVRIPRFFLARALSEIERRGLGSATAEARPLSNLRMDRLIHRFANLFVRLNQETDPHAPGYCILARKEVFDRIGGFDETIKVAEDHDFVTRASEIAPFRMLESVWFKVSVRRYEKEGRLNYALKAAKISVYRATRGEITDTSVVEYEFGDFEAEDKTATQKTLRRFERAINSLDKKTQKLERKIERSMAREESVVEQYRNAVETIRETLRDAGEQLFNQDDRE